MCLIHFQLFYLYKNCPLCCLILHYLTIYCILLFTIANNESEIHTHSQKTSSELQNKVNRGNFSRIYSREKLSKSSSSSPWSWGIITLSVIAGGSSNIPPPSSLLRILSTEIEHKHRVQHHVIITWPSHRSNQLELTQNSSIAVLQVGVPKVVVVEVSGFVREVSGTRLRFQKQGGGRGSMDDVHLKSILLPHHLTIIHAKVTWYDVTSIKLWSTQNSWLKCEQQYLSFYQSHCRSWGWCFLLPPSWWSPQHDSGSGWTAALHLYHWGKKKLSL